MRYSVSAIALLVAFGVATASPSVAQNAPKGGAGGTSAAPAGGASAGGGEAPELMPGGKAAAGGGASPVVKPGAESPAVRPNTAGQPAPDQPPGGEKTGTAPDEKASSDQQKSGNGTPAMKKSGETNSSGQTNPKSVGQARQAPKISTTQKTEVTKAIRADRTVKPVANINFALNVGVAVPRTIEFHRLPPAVITLVPEYEDYSYFETEDAIVIVDPDTLEIVYILPI